MKIVLIVFIVLVLSLIFVAVIFFIYKSIAKEVGIGMQEINLMKNGVDAEAVIQDVKLRSGGNDSYPGVTISLLVYKNNNETYSGVIETDIAVTHMYRFQPGSKVKVKFNSEDPLKLILNEPTR